MTDLIKIYINSFLANFRGETSLEEAVRYSVKKYYNTYKKLEEYDKESKQESKILVDPEGLQEYFRPFL